jgi:hypothetical protein
MSGMKNDKPEILVKLCYRCSKTLGLTKIQGKYVTPVGEPCQICETPRLTLKEIPVRSDLENMKSIRLDIISPLLKPEIEKEKSQPISQSKFDIGKEFTAGFTAGMFLLSPLDTTKSDHWQSGWNVGYGHRKIKNDALNEYLKSIGQEPMHVVHLA